MTHQSAITHPARPPHTAHAHTTHKISQSSGSLAARARLLQSPITPRASTHGIIQRLQLAPHLFLTCMSRVGSRPTSTVVGEHWRGPSSDQAQDSWHRVVAPLASLARPKRTHTPPLTGRAWFCPHAGDSEGAHTCCRVGVPWGAPSDESGGHRQRLHRDAAALAAAHCRRPRAAGEGRRASAHKLLRRAPASAIRRGSQTRLAVAVG